MANMEVTFNKGKTDVSKIQRGEVMLVTRRAYFGCPKCMSLIRLTKTHNVIFDIGGNISIQPNVVCRSCNVIATVEEGVIIFIEENSTEDINTELDDDINEKEVGEEHF